MTHSEKIIRKFWRLKQCVEVRHCSFGPPNSRWWAYIGSDSHCGAFGRTQAESCARAMAKMKETKP